MTDVIQLLPESVANQIAAGEVVQRPASVVKELLENAIDAGATQLKLMVREAGKTLIQVVDNGCGMSETDARMSFERHATSKIRDARDLFAIRTMGFRGEALASIAAVAQVELRTRRAAEELGTRILIEDSTIKAHEPFSGPSGTNLAVRNLFYNVPARRNFLKSDTVEMRHILDEFQRVAMAHPDLFFSLHHNDQEIFHLPPGNLRQRIVKIFGESLNKKLVPVLEETDVLRISGFVGKPDYFKKARGEQLFFVNKRFIKSNYLHHAVVAAYDDLLPSDAYPFYVLFLDIDPARIDINVHPTKQEIKFDDEKLVYHYLKVTVRHALGSNNITPTLDFEQESAFTGRPIPLPSLRQESSRNVGSGGNDENRHAENLRRWQQLYEGMNAGGQDEESTTPPSGETDERFTQTSSFEVMSGTDSNFIDDESGSFSRVQKEPYQIHGHYIVNQIKSGFLLIDQQAASERILYERYLQALQQQAVSTQKALFPKHLELPPADAALLRDILNEINDLGFDVAEFGGNTFIIHGYPDTLPSGREEELLEKVLHQYKENLELELGVTDNLARSMARNAALRRGQILGVAEMQDLIDQLFACASPYHSPSGRKCFITMEIDELNKRFSS